MILRKESKNINLRFTCSPLRALPIYNIAVITKSGKLRVSISKTEKLKNAHKAEKIHLGYDATEKLRKYAIFGDDKHRSKEIKENMKYEKNTRETMRLTFTTASSPGFFNTTIPYIAIYYGSIFEYFLTQGPTSIK